MKPIIHVGLPKAASTTLQLRYFENHPELIYLGSTSTSESQHRIVRTFFEEVNRIPSRKTPRREQNPNFYSSLIYPDNWRRISRRRHEADALTEFRMFVSELSEEREGKVVISSEGFSVGVFIPPLETAERLHATFDEATILLVLRRPVDWLKSRYLQMFRGIGPKLDHMPGINEWLKYNLARQDHFQSMYHDLRWGGLVGHYNRLFGQENVHVVLFEDFVSDTREFMLKLSEIVGVNLLHAPNPSGMQDHLNPSLTRGELLLLRSGIVNIPYVKKIAGPLKLVLRWMFPERPRLKVSDNILAETATFVNRELADLPESVKRQMQSREYFPEVG